MLSLNSLSGRLGKYLAKDVEQEERSAKVSNKNEV